MSKELHLKYRPTKFKEIIGHSVTCEILAGKIKDESLSHTVMFTGPTGVGKTTLARICATELGITPVNIIEQNCASVRDMESVRDIEQQMWAAQMGGTGRAWIFDEVVQLLKPTQQAMLKMLEDTPPHVWFFLCSSDTKGLLPTFMSRMFRFDLKALRGVEIQDVLTRALQGEKKELSGEVRAEIVDRCGGSARMALQLLEAALCIKEKTRQMEAVGAAAGELEGKTEFLAKLLMKGGNWSEVAVGIADMDLKDVEGLRLKVLAYCDKVLLHGRDGRMAARVIMAFEDPFYTKAAFDVACWRCVTRSE